MANNTHPYTEILNAFLSMIEQKEISILRKSERIARSGVAFAKALGMSKQEIVQIHLACLLHDIGMIYITSDIIHKPDELSEGEMAMVKLHPTIGETILSKLSFFKGTVPIVRHHHEEYNGSGYPDGLTGDAIPVGARILSLLAGYDAMSVGGPNKEALNKEKILEDLDKNSGEQFDKTLVEKFIKFSHAAEPPAPASQPAKKEGGDNKKSTISDAINSIVQKFKDGKIDLPVLPTVVHDMQKVIKNPVSTADDIAELIEKDAAISLRLLNVSNSAMYRGAEKIKTVRKAVPRLGIKKTHSLVVAIANKNLYKVKDDELKNIMEQFWTHSLATAFAAKGLAEKLEIPDSESLFLMGLSHDIGKVLLFNPLTAIVSQKEALNLDEILKSIQEVHTNFGSALLQRWKFPAEIQKTTRMHDAKKFTEETLKEVLIVNLANILTRTIGYSLFNDEEIDLAECESAKLLKIDAESLDKISGETRKAVRDSKNVF